MLLNNTSGMEWLTTIFQTLKPTTTHHPEEELDILSIKKNAQKLSQMVEGMSYTQGRVNF